MYRQTVDIWTDLHQELNSFILSKVKDVEITNDILQDIFLKIQMNIHTLNDSSKLTSWVYQITRNTVTDYFRKAISSIQIDNIDIADKEYDEPLYQSLSNCINSKISLLPDKYRQAILLTTFESYSQMALSKELGISYSGAKTRVQRAREKLKELIIDCKNLDIDDKGNLISYQSPSK